ncbi:MAG: VCBS repeat-containing protein [Bacteroidota bacterium]
MRKIAFLSIVLALFACSKEAPQTPLFRLVPSTETDITFSNDLTYSDDFNPYIFKNFFNGGGVAMGDLNKDGFADLFFCGNMVDNKLYLNRGDFQFEDITEKSGVASKNVWSSGVSFADVNGDGWLDIYVCKSGKPGGELRYNELFINQGLDAEGNLQFQEMAKAYGIADEGLSAHAAFFDYDKDGDLDMYLLNNSLRSVGGFDIRPGLREIRDTFGGNKLYRNELVGSDNLDGVNPPPSSLQRGKDVVPFTDVSEEAGIYGSNIGYGLGVTIGDVNKDGWQDIHISNDFFERDYLYINNQDGTFTEDLVNRINEISAGSMGADMADINNDGYPEIFVTDMLPETEDRYKSKMTFENWNKYQLNVQNGYHHQFTRNVLQLNNQDGTFSEIGRLAGVHATDWSWSALLADLDNDGYKDVYVTNGIYQDLMDQDYINYYATDPSILGAIRRREEGAILKLIEKMPSEPIPNYVFQNNQNLTFSKRTEAWGLATPSFSNGAVYGDLDNDGDLDLVVNNCNMPAFVYENRADTLLENNYLAIQLVGEKNNVFALGTQVTLTVGDQTLYQELVTSKGFQSSIDYRLNFGLGTANLVDKLHILWPNGKETIRENVSVNQLLAFEQNTGETSTTANSSKKTSPIFAQITENIPLTFEHQENTFSDFDRDRLLFQMISAEGPKMATGDVNSDGLEDVFIGGAKGQAAALFIQQTNGQFQPSNEAPWAKSRQSEDTDALFFDADGDGDLDLYVARGSNEFTGLSAELIDRLYLNDGVGNFTQSPQRLPNQRKTESTACVKAADVDQDGDLDLLVGVRLKTGVYGVPVSSYLLTNDGRGNFTDATSTVAPDLAQIGMVTDANWADIDGDQDLDLVVIGDWMPITVLENQNGILAKADKFQLPQSNGFWNCLQACDFNQDGKIDFVLGNHGQNTRLKASVETPMTMHVNDFDKNRTAEQIISVHNEDAAYPLALRHDLVMQLPSLKKKYLLYEKYKNQQIDQIFDEKQVRTAAKSTIYTTTTSVALNNGDGTFNLKPLPIEAQFAPVYGLLVKDFTGDGALDILMGGNFYRSKPEVGIYDASYGLLLKGNGKGGFSAVSAAESGFRVKGEIRDLAVVSVGGKEVVLVGRNDEAVLNFEVLSR